MPSLRSVVKLPFERYKAPYAACIVLYNTIITLSNHTQRSCYMQARESFKMQVSKWAKDKALNGEL